MGILEILLAYSARQSLANEKIAHCAEAKKQKYTIFQTNVF